MSNDKDTLINRKSSDLARWTARQLHPIIVYYVALIFTICIAIAYFVLQSPTAVKTLAITAFGVIVSLLPSLISKVEYQMTEAGLIKRPFNSKKPGSYKDVFQWSQLSHVIPIRQGFKYYKTMNESNRLRRIWNAHISDAFSGEVHVETKDRDRVLAILKKKEIAFSKPVADSPVNQHQSSPD